MKWKNGDIIIASRDIQQRETLADITEYIIINKYEICEVVDASYENIANTIMNEAGEYLKITNSKMLDVFYTKMEFRKLQIKKILK